jgi:hypothetical protein
MLRRDSSRLLTSQSVVHPSDRLEHVSRKVPTEVLAFPNFANHAFRLTQS